MLGERCGQARLADAGIAEDEVHATATSAGVRVRVAELLQLPDPPDKRSLTGCGYCGLPFSRHAAPLDGGP